MTIAVRTVCVICACLMPRLVDDAFSPARYRAGSLPAMPAMAVGGGQVILEVAVDREGRVNGIEPLRTTPPFTTLVVGAVREWVFAPATESEAIASKVLVAAVFRPPTLNVPTLGERPADIASPPADIPFPLAITEPAYPPAAFSGGVVLVEALVDRNGRIADVLMIRPVPPFDDAVRAALRGWSFQPARVRGTPVDAYVYLLFGFAVPVT